MTIELSHKLEQYTFFINNTVNTNVLFEDNEYTQDDLYRGLLAHYVLNNLLEISDFPPDTCDRSIFNDDHLVSKWFKAYYPDYPEYFYVYDGLDDYIGKVQNKYNFISDIVAGDLTFKIIDTTYLKNMTDTDVVYIRPNLDLYIKNDNSRFRFLSVNTFISECLIHQNFELLTQSRNFMYFRETYQSFAKSNWNYNSFLHQSNNTTKINSLRLYCIANEIDDSFISLDQLRLPIEMELGLLEIFDIYKASLQPINSVSCPNF